jgi:uncharacterized paraquat-inducible protein A
MTCVQCNTPYDTSDSFCRNCGAALKYTKPMTNSRDDDYQASTLLLVYMCWSFFMALVYLMLNKVAMKSDGAMSIGKIYEIMGWFSQVSNFLLLLIFAIIVKSNRVRTFLIIFTAIELLLIIGYRVFKN